VLPAFRGDFFFIRKQFLLALSNKFSQMPELKSIAILDDHDHWRHILVDLVFKRFKSVQTIIEASSGQRLIDEISELDIGSSPQIALLDLSMRQNQQPDGFAVAKWIYTNRPEIRIVSISLKQNEQTIIQLMRSGVLGFLHKNGDIEDIVDGIMSALEGDWYVCPALNIQGETQSMKLDSIAQHKRVLYKYLQSTPKEKEIINILCSELTKDEMCRKLGLAKSSLEMMIQQIYNRFEVGGRIPLILLAYKYKFVT
jgi:two-component system, NarL family, invasion response regulator UvrY